MLTAACLTASVFTGFLCFGRLVRGQTVTFGNILCFSASVTAFAYSMHWIP